MRSYIPSSVIANRSSHPWLTPECLTAVQAKVAASGTEVFAVASRVCSDTLLKAHAAYVERMRAKLRNLRRGSKAWWRVSDQILSRVSKPVSSPLKRPDGSWAVSSLEKADVFAASFASKWDLPLPENNIFSDLSEVLAPPSPHAFLRLRTRAAKHILSDLFADSGTGPDLVPARVLKMCAAELALPVCLLARKIVEQSRWPECWCEHWICPLHKKRTVVDPDNYRGIQLTAQLSKAVERFVGELFVPRLEQVGAFGPFQFAYRKGHGARDAILYFTLSWLSSFALGFRIALYCSDVSGAFDHVDASRLTAKLQSFSLPPPLVSLISSWLRQRSACVVVSGQKSSPITMNDMVYQGTVWGPPLWNTYFSDACIAIRGTGFDEVVYADDLNAFRPILPCVSNPAAQGMMSECQSALHEWGRADSVTFDSGKESFHIFYRFVPVGDSFKILGILFDPKLLMYGAVDSCIAACSWKIYSLIRTRRFHTDADLVGLYKAHVLSFIEYRTSAISHASTSVLEPLDNIQIRFLRTVSISADDALFYFNLAPLSSRRDMAILVIHRSALGRGPSCFSRFVRLDSSVPPGRAPRRHFRHLAEPFGFRAPDYILHSALGAVRIYNLLPDFVVQADTVSEFQSRLQCLLRARAPQCTDWPSTFSCRLPLAFHPLRSCRDWRPPR